MQRGHRRTGAPSGRAGVARRGKRGGWATRLKENVTKSVITTEVTFAPSATRHPPAQPSSSFASYPSGRRRVTEARRTEPDWRPGSRRIYSTSSKEQRGSTHRVRDYDETFTAPGGPKEILAVRTPRATPRVYIRTSQSDGRTAPAPAPPVRVHPISRNVRGQTTPVSGDWFAGPVADPLWSTACRSRCRAEENRSRRDGTSYAT